MTKEDPGALPPDSYAIMVHQNFVDRVSAYLTTTDSKKRPASTVTVLDQQELKGHLRGYVLLLVTRAQRPISEISPMARQNISWVSTMHYGINQTLPDDVLGPSFDYTKDILRVETHPRSLNEEICSRLEAYCCRKHNLPLPKAVFEGPINFTKSKTKCTHKLTVISSDNNDGGTLYYGLENRQQHNDILSLRLNHEASSEIAQGTHVSRAYFKLHQVFQDFGLAAQQLTSTRNAIDLGASPGGWTQVLVEHGFSVVAVDKGLLHDDVLRLPAVTHLQCRMQQADLTAYGPFSLVVCDASIIWPELKPILIEQVAPKARWSLPCSVVLTIKLPFKRTSSIKRQLEQLDIDNFVKELCRAMFVEKDVAHRFELVHLMANADAERTLVAWFEDR